MKSSARGLRGTLARLPKIESCSSPAVIYLSNLAPSGRRSMRKQLAMSLQLAGYEPEVETFSWSKFDYQHLKLVRAKLLAHGYAPATINLTMAALKGVLAVAFDLGIIDAEALLRAKAVKGVRNHVVPRGRSLTSKQLERLIKQCKRDRGARGARDAALIALMSVTGLRRAEVCAIAVTDLDNRYIQVTVRRAKGNQARICPIPSAVVAVLRRWLGFRGLEDGALFCPINRAGVVERRALSGQGLCVIIQSRSEAAGLGHITPHDFRRTFVSRLLESGVDINQVCQLVGHSDVSVTSRYDRRAVEARRLVGNILAS